MTEPRVARCSSAYGLTLAVCAKPISSRPEDDRAKVGFEKMKNKGKTHLPPNLLLWLKGEEVLEVVRRARKTSLGCFVLGLFSWSSVSFFFFLIYFSNKKTRVCAETPWRSSVLGVLICKAHLQLHFSFQSRPLQLMWTYSRWIECICGACRVKVSDSGLFFGWHLIFLYFLWAPGVL